MCGRNTEIAKQTFWPPVVDLLTDLNDLTETQSFYSNFKLFEDERRDGRSEHDEDETVQGEAPEAEVVPILGAAALRLHVGNQSHGQRARSRLVARSD